MIEFNKLGLFFDICFIKLCIYLLCKVILYVCFMGFLNKLK